MSLLQRMKNSLRADAHAVVDALEDEALLLKQCLRDAETEVQRKRGRLAQLEADSKRLGFERERALSETQRAERDVELALTEGRDDLARYCLRRALTQKNLSERITNLMAGRAEEQKELHVALQAQQVALDELRARVQTFLSQRELGHPEAMVVPVNEEQIELELLRRKSSHSPARTEAQEVRDDSK